MGRWFDKFEQKKFSGGLFERKKKLRSSNGVQFCIFTRKLLAFNEIMAKQMRGEAVAEIAQREEKGKERKRETSRVCSPLYVSSPLSLPLLGLLRVFAFIRNGRWQPKIVTLSLFVIKFWELLNYPPTSFGVRHLSMEIRHVLVPGPTRHCQLLAVIWLDRGVRWSGVGSTGWSATQMMYSEMVQNVEGCGAD